MLVYVRVSDWPRLMSEPGLGDIAEHLRQRFQQEQEAKETRQKQKQEAHLYCTLKVATDADIARQVRKGGERGVEGEVRQRTFPSSARHHSH